ncbi:site-specific tyrosine recombinase XerC [Erwinia psidii]|nr:site-specific tyrosine recombinase XerC [Erwinia psidii]
MNKRTMRAEMVLWLEWCRERNSSASAIKTKELALLRFIRWSEERGLLYPQEVTRPVLECWQTHLYQHRKRNGHPLSFYTQRTQLAPVVSWFRWLTRSNRLLSNPASDLVLPREGRRLPKEILTAREVEQILNVPDIREAEGLRDRAILEVLYSTGIRRSELAGLHEGAVDNEHGTVMIREGKGLKDRVVPVGDRALKWLERYQTSARPALLGGWQREALFLRPGGKPVTPDWLTKRVGQLVSSGTGKKGSCHLFRHTMATLMLENGADTRWIQVMLGHEKLETTQIYTRVSIGALKAVHSATHPAEQQEPEPADDAEPDAATQSPESPLS